MEAINTDCLPRELTSQILRRGKWTDTEEKYAEQIIADFDEGVLNVEDGTTLRSYLSQALNCDPMRITKKYTGSMSIGKRTYAQKGNYEEKHKKSFVLQRQRLLEDLRQTWISKLIASERLSDSKTSSARNSSTPRIPSSALQLRHNGALDKALYNFIPPSNNNDTALGGFTPYALAHSSSANYGAGYSQLFNEAKIAFALTPFCSAIEVQQVVHWLFFAYSAIESNFGVVDSVGLMEQLTTSAFMLSVTSLYKVLLSGCVADNSHLHSCVQAVFEKQMLLAEYVAQTSSSTDARCESPQDDVSACSKPLAKSPRRLDTTIDDANAECVKRVKIETLSDESVVIDCGNRESDSIGDSATSDVCSRHVDRPNEVLMTSASPPPHPQLSVSQVGDLYDSVFPTPICTVIPPVAADSSTAESDKTVNRLTLDDCLGTLQQESARQGFFQGPISQGAMEYFAGTKSIQSPLFASSYGATADHTSSTGGDKSSASAAVAAKEGTAEMVGGFLINPLTFRNKLQASLDRSISAIAERVVRRQSGKGTGMTDGVDHHTHVVYAAEALMELIQQQTW